MFSRSIICKKCEENAGEAVRHEEKLCNEVETVREFTYLDDRVRAGGVYEAALTARTRCGWVRLRICGELLYGKMFY